MTSTATAASPAATPTSSSNRPQLKTSATPSNAAPNANRRSVQSPIDGSAQRRNSSQKGWHQSPQTKLQHNGNVGPNTPGPQSSAMAKPKPAESDTQDKHMHDRMLFLLISLTGKMVTLTLKSGARFSGVLSGASTSQNDIGCALKWVKQIRAAPGHDDYSIPQGYLGRGPEKTVIFEAKDVVEIYGEKVALGDGDMPKNGHNGVTTTGFRTDSDISGGGGPTRERELHRWEPTAEDGANSSLHLEESSSSGVWDQFEANEKLFGVTSDFDENLYTTKLDRSHPQYPQLEAHAAKIAKEIESETAGLNAHVAEERGVTWRDDSGMDEEDKYSGVQRPPLAQPSQVNFFPLSASATPKYTPPAKRPPTGYPTVPGAPYDPAIIASQLARPETAQPKHPKQQTTQLQGMAVTSQLSNVQPSPAQSQTVSSPAIQVSPAQAGAQVLAPQVKITPAAMENATEEVSKPLNLPDVAVKKPVVATALPTAQVTAPPSSSNQHIEKQVHSTFKEFVNTEKERYEQKKRELLKKDKDIKLEDLRKFSKTFKLNTPVPTDLIPILAKDKTKQEEIIEKSRQNMLNPQPKPSPSQSTNASTTAPTGVATTATSITTATAVPATAPNSSQFDKTSFRHAQKAGYAQHNQGFLRDKPSPQGGRYPNLPNQPHPLGQRLTQSRLAHRAGHPIQAPLPIAEAHHLNSSSVGQKPHSPTPSVVTRMNAKASEFKPNPNAISFTPNYGPGSTATPSPTASVGHANASRAASPSAFFGNKKLKTGKEKASVNDFFNPFKRIKESASAGTQTLSPSKGQKAKDGKIVIDKPFTFQPTWLVRLENSEKKYDQIFDKPDFSISNMVHSPQPPHMHPQTSHHPQMAPHIQHPHQPPPPHISHHQPHHSHHPQHLIPPPHFEAEHMRPQLSSPPSVMPSPHLQNAQITGFGSPATHHAQLSTMYPQPHGQIQYGVPGAPGTPHFAYGMYRQFIQPGTNGATGNPVLVPGQPHVPYMTPFVPVYSPQQMHAYPSQGGPPPPAPPSTGYPSPRGAPMMMHQGSTQGQPPPPPPQIMVNPQQAGAIYGGGQQQQMGNMMRTGYPHHHYHQPHYPPNARPGAYSAVQPHPGVPPSGPHAPPNQPQPPLPQPAPQQGHQTDAGEDSK